MEGSAVASSPSASTETLSDLEDKALSEVSVRRSTRYTEKFGSEEPGSVTESNVEIFEDSEATVSDDPNLHGSDSDTIDTNSWQPSPKLTLRQQARQQRLLQGISQTQWDDMTLPKELDFSNRNKQKDVLSEEQHLKKLKDAEMRRDKTQQARRDTLENTKARIRAATSNKFKDMLGNGHVEKRRVVRSIIRFAPGRVKVRKRPIENLVILPEGSELPHGLKARKLTSYPSTKILQDFVVDPPCPKEKFRLGCRFELVSKDHDRIGLFFEGVNLCDVIYPHSSSLTNCFGTLKSLYHGNEEHHISKIVLRLTNESDT